MPRITFTADEQHESIIEDMEERDDIDSTAAAVRACIMQSSELQQETERLQNRVQELETEVERLRNEKRQLIADREEKQELVAYVEREREMDEQKRQAPVWERAKWWVFGQRTG